MRLQSMLAVGVLAVFATAVAPVTAAADDDTSTLKVTVVGGELEISVKSETRNFGTVKNTPGGTIVSGSLGEVTVRDNRNAPDGSSWVATAAATELKPNKGRGIPAANIRYNAGTVSKQGTCTIQAGETATLNRSRPVVTASQIRGKNVAKWTPTITVKIPAGVVAGTYTGTITHSVL
jgi:hypothetical protein